MAITMRVRCVMLDANDNDEWEVELQPDEKIIKVERDGNRAWFYIEGIVGF